MTTSTSYSLRDALDLEDAPPSIQTETEEQAEAEAAVAELGRDSDSDEPAAASSTGATTAASAFSLSANRPVKIDQSPAPSPEQATDLNRSAAAAAAPPPAPAVAPANHYGKKPDTTPNRVRKRIPVLRGTLFFNEDWDDATNTTVRRSVLSGTWRYSEEPPEKQNPSSTFEIVAKEAHPSSSSLEPQDGHYNSTFSYTYPHVTPKGKRSTKTATIKEVELKMNFRKRSGGFYNITGRGSNRLGGDFSVNGKAKPTTEGGGGYTVEIRKIYLADTPGASSGGRTAPRTAAAHSVRNDGSSLPRSQQQSVYARSSPQTSPATLPRPVRNLDSTPTRRSEASPAAPALNPPREPVPPSSPPPPRKNPERRDIPVRPSPQLSSATPMLPQSMPSQMSSSTPGGVDRVNGKGMWHAWTRSFDTPLLALLDLFDNAVDASWTLLPDQPNRDAHYAKPKIRVDLDWIGRNGVVMRNSSRFIPPLQQVLQVYKSSKAGDGDNSIGENGIGVKHACASLSGLSFVFTKTTSAEGNCTMSMGILMQELQRDDGIVLPSVAFDLDDGDLEEVQRRLEEHCAEFPDTWGTAIREYGDDHFGDGIDRCLQHMDALRTHKDWKHSDNVFAVVLANLKHAAFDNDEDEFAPGGGDDDEVIVINGNASSPARQRTHRSGRHGTTTNGEAAYHTVRAGGDSDIDEDKQRSLSLLKTLRTQLPYLYLHLHDLDICVEGRAIESIYWERRLGELSRFELQLSQTELWSKMQKERYSHNHPMSVFKITKPEETVRFFCGFDPYRCKNKYGKVEGSDDDAMSMVPGGSGIPIMGNNTAIKIYLYSRQSGRLIKVQNDPRNELGLTAGSTDFCQGMTVIIDDHNGTLPLNPTKQDTAYGHSKHGQIHAANLKEWTAAISHFYWNYHYVRFGSSKVAVTHAVASTQTSLEEAYKNHCARKNRADGELDDRINDDRYPTITPLCKGMFIAYKNIDFSLSTYHNTIKIRANKNARENATPTVNHREVSRLVVSAATLQEVSARKRRRAAKTTMTQDDAEVSRHVSSLEVASAPPKRLRSAHHEEMALGDMAPPTAPIPLPPQHDGSAMAMENHTLKQQMQRYYNQNLQDGENLKRATNQLMMMQNRCQTLTEEKTANLQKLHGLHLQNKRLEEQAKHHEREAAWWKAEAEQLRATNGTMAPPPSPGVVDLTSGEADNAEVEKLRREVKIYKSRADFYQRETAAKKQQIEGLMEEKSRFEERVHELEAAQLSVDAQDGDLLHF